MTTGVSVRQRYPEHTKQLKVTNTYEKYAQFEAAFTDITRIEDGGSDIAKRVEELKYESAKTLEALKGKQAVRIPEIRRADEEDKLDGVAEKGKAECPMRWVEAAERTRQYPLKKKEFNRPGHYIRYFSKKEGEPDTQYNYEAVTQDLDFLHSLPGAPFTVGEFEKLMDLFEKENYAADCPTTVHKPENGEADSVKHFQSLSGALDQLKARQPMSEIEGIYNVRRGISG